MKTKYTCFAIFGLCIALLAVINSVIIDRVVDNSKNTYFLKMVVREVDVRENTCHLTSFNNNEWLWDIESHQEFYPGQVWTAMLHNNHTPEDITDDIILRLE